MITSMRHVLICRTDNLGDVVLTLPLAGYLRQLFPALKIGFLCRRYAAAVVAQSAAIDYVVERETLDGSLDEAVAWLSEARIDTIIFAKPDRRLGAAAKKAGIAQRVGTSHRWFHWMYCNRLAHFSRVKSTLHEAQLNFALLRPLGIDTIPPVSGIAPLYRMRAPSAATSNPDEAGAASWFDPACFNLILHPKSNGNGREWPVDHFVALAKLLSTEPAIRLWITGSENEGVWLARHAPSLLQQPNVRNLCGSLSLAQLTARIATADGLIASGTGPVHIAAATGQRTLGLYPPLKPIHPGRWAPIGLRAQTLARSEPCNGCADPADCACMRSITPQEVAQIVFGWQREARMSAQTQ